MTKANEIKKKHHHVWDHYIRRWSPDGKNVWYRTPKDKVRSDSPKGLAREEEFYKLKRISQKQAEIIRMFSSKSNKKMHQHHMSYLNDFLLAQYMEDKYLALGSKDPSVEHQIKVRQNNTLENIHTRHEIEARPIIDELANRNLGVLNTTENMIKFMMFFGHQISRTKTFRDNVLSANKILQGSEAKVFTDTIRECWWFVSYILGMNIGFGIFASKSDANQCLLINNTDEPFITSDQPIVNVHKCTYNKLNALEAPEFADFYYPISPTVGFMINDSDEFGKGVIDIGLDVVEKLNRKVANRANIYIFGNNEAVIKKYMGQVGGNKQIINRFIDQI
ncbi:TPA: DUF4238 domain-containing protein [Photobacterium damselae]